MYTELINSSTSAGLTSETLSYVTAFVENYTIIEQPISDGGIIVERFLIPVKDIYNFLKETNQEKYSIASPTVCGIFYALKRLEM